MTVHKPTPSTAATVIGVTTQSDGSHQPRSISAFAGNGSASSPLTATAAAAALTAELPNLCQSRAPS